MPPQKASALSVLKHLVQRLINDKAISRPSGPTRQNQLVSSLRKAIGKVDGNPDSVLKMIERILDLPSVAEVRGDRNNFGSKNIPGIERILDSMLATDSGSSLARFVADVGSAQLPFLERLDRKGAAEIAPSFKDRDIEISERDREIYQINIKK